MAYGCAFEVLVNLCMVLQGLDGRSTCSRPSREEMLKILISRPTDARPHLNRSTGSSRHVEHSVYMRGMLCFQMTYHFVSPCSKAYKRLFYIICIE